MAGSQLGHSKSKAMAFSNRNDATAVSHWGSPAVTSSSHITYSNAVNPITNLPFEDDGYNP